MPICFSLTLFLVASQHNTLDGSIRATDERIAKLPRDLRLAALSIYSVNQLHPSHFMLVERQQYTLYCHAIFWGTAGLGEGCVKIMQIVSYLELMANLFIFIHNGGI